MSKYLFIGAHPDDIEFGCGGTIAKLIEAKHQCIFVIATNGEQGDQNTPPKELSAIRRTEAIEAAKSLGIKDIEFLELPDGMVQMTIASKVKLIEIIRQYRPDFVFTHSKKDKHSDHQIIHKLSLDAVNIASGPWYYETKGRPYAVKNVLGYEVWSPINEFQTCVDITSYIDQKIAALDKHKSQVQNYPYSEAVKGLANYRGAMAQGGGLAEVFEVYRLDSSHVL